MAVTSGLNETKKLAKRIFLSDLEDMLLEAGYEFQDGADLEMKGTILVVRNVSTDKGVCDLKITVTAPAKGTRY